jgi:hypothetical protein
MTSKYVVNTIYIYLVYKNKPRNVDELKDTIRDKFPDISVELCRKTCLSVVGRVHECLARERQHFNVTPKML